MTDEEMMKALDLTPAELQELKAFDKAIDKGADPNPLTPEQKKVEKQMRQADRAPTVYQFQKRERKPNDDKRCIVEQIVRALEPNCDAAIEVTNPEREIVFNYNGKKYKLTLSAPRT